MALSYVQPYTTPVTGGSFPGWPQAAQGLQQLWLARNGAASATPGTPLAAAVTAGQPYPGVEQDYAVQCDEAPSPPASAYAGLQRLVVHRSGVIGNTTDPFLPLGDAIAMSRQLANARLLVVNGYGHTAFLNPSTCASNYMTAYSRTGALPPKGAVCGQNLPPFPLPAG